MYMYVCTYINHIVVATLYAWKGMLECLLFLHLIVMECRDYACNISSCRWHRWVCEGDQWCKDWPYPRNTHDWISKPHPPTNCPHWGGNYNYVQRVFWSPIIHSWSVIWVADFQTLLTGLITPTCMYNYVHVCTYVYNFICISAHYGACDVKKSTL